MGINVGLIALALSVFGATAQSDEGLARITTLGDRGLVAQMRKDPKTSVKEEPRYKSVEQEDHSSSTSSSEYHQNFFAGLGFDYFDAFGIQGRYAVRVLDGLIEDISNPLYLEGGLGMTFYGDVKGKRGVSGFNFVVTGRWDFPLDSEWTLFADVGFGFNAVSSGLTAQDVHGGGFFPAAGVGGMYNFTSNWAARVDLSYQFIGAGAQYSF